MIIFNTIYVAQLNVVKLGRKEAGGIDCNSLDNRVCHQKLPTDIRFWALGLQMCFSVVCRQILSSSQDKI